MTVDVSPIRKDSTGQITAEADKTGMTSDRSGAAVTSGRTTVTVVEIGEERVHVDVTHPDHEPQRAEIALGSEKDVVPGDMADGVRVHASRYQA